jgi:GNAT superfamily N-acetyltransferase
MTRPVVTLRQARPDDPEDVAFLAEVWAEVLRRCDAEDRAADVVTLAARAADSEDERLIVAEHDGQRAGAVLLRLATLTPVNLEPVVQTLSPHVLPAFRRRGVGRALVEAAASFAEEHGIAHVMTASSSGSREANRFMARLGFGPLATLRVAPTAIVRSKTGAQRAPLRGPGASRPLGQVLAARRAVRREPSR